MMRDSMNGSWILDKSRDSWSICGYLQTMNVDDLAIEAHEKGEIEHDTVHTITLNPPTVQVVKRSRVNADLTVDLELGRESVELLQPGNRPKKSLATSENQRHLVIQSSLHTMNGIAQITDVKQLEHDGDQCVLKQELTIRNLDTGNSHTTVRYFLPYTIPDTAVVVDE